MQDAIDRATRELQAGDSRFYKTVREAWRACRCAELATMLEVLARKHGRPAIDIAKPKAWHAAWIERVREGNPLDLPGLLAGLVTQAVPRQASMVASCLDELARFSDDPLLVEPLITILAVEPASSSWNKVHTRLFQLLEAAGDPRAIALLAPAIDVVAKLPAGWSDSMRDSLARASRTRERLAAKFPDGVPSLPTDLDSRELLDATPAKPLATVVRVDELDALYQAVLDDPDDDGRRAVYADALQLRGDIRGEIIALQLACTPAASSKAKGLIEKHRKTLLGGIAKTVIATTAVFEKGFLVSCETDVRRAVEAEVAFGRAEWATVKRLKFRSHGALSSVMRSLEEAYNVPESALASLRKCTLPKLRLLELRQAHTFVDGESRGALAAFATTTNLPALREVHLSMPSYFGRTADDFTWLLKAPSVAQIERLVVTWNGEQNAIAGWQYALDSHPTLRTIELTSTTNRVLERTTPPARAR
ncbi:MAG: TIGR02996 domain-containing protein [Myxococcota bacterium]|nr:TIGR02996 domain-containing protein [Deltaproteobacteria bacterium]MDQ3341473.1 TIGR02996 domain-containing protein [Myxococcota bacterium]